ncbi:ComF family protein [Candidatus Uhrbacteria bacterium]|nr:ComF family protein [Candidatus Uhrbacteria bacterium]
MRTIAQKMKAAVLDIFYPRLCIACGSYGAWVCEPCAQKLPACSFGVASRQAQGIPCHAVYSYDSNMVRTIVHALKYEGVKELATFMSCAMSRWWRKNSVLNVLPLDRSILIPIPLHIKKLRERGWNQAELIAHELGSQLGVSVESGALIRTKNTQPQSSLSRQERILNMKDAFLCVPTASMEGKIIILIDDVATTGATLNQAASALRMRGGTDIRGFVCARGDQA